MIYDSACKVYNPFDEPADNSLRIKTLLLVETELLEQLFTPEQQLIIRLVVMEGVSQTKVAEQLRVNKSTVSRELKKCLALLSVHLGFCDKALRIYERISADLY